jgi:hypothetical protein
MSDATYQRFVKRWEEVTELPPQSLGPLTGAYKWFTRRFKVMPWPWFIAISIVVAGILYVLFGTTISFIVTLLQKSF